MNTKPTTIKKKRSKKKNKTEEYNQENNQERNHLDQKYLCGYGKERKVVFILRAFAKSEKNLSFCFLKLMSYDRK